MNEITQNPYEYQRRMVKACKIADKAEELGYTRGNERRSRVGGVGKKMWGEEALKGDLGSGCDSVT